MHETPGESESTTEQFERLLGEPRPGAYVLQLYISGMSPRSTLAIRELKSICDTWLKDRYTLQITDLYDEPALAREHQVVAAPTLIRHSPLPIRRLVGDLSDHDLVLRLLDIA